MATAKKTSTARSIATVDMDDKVKAFGRAMGNGITATQHFADLVKNASENGMDTRYIAAAITNLERDGDRTGASTAKKIVGVIFNGATVGKSKDGRTVTIRTKKATLDADAFKRLMEAAEKKTAVNFRDSLLKKVKGESATPKKDAAWVENNAAPNLVKNGIAAGLTEAQILGMVRKAFAAEKAVN